MKTIKVNNTLYPPLNIEMVGCNHKRLKMRQAALKWGLIAILIAYVGYNVL